MPPNTSEPLICHVTTARLSPKQEGAEAGVVEDTKVYVGNLSWGTESEDLNQIFEEFGEVVAADVVYDNQTGRSRGFGFVTMSTAAEAEAAIEALNQTVSC